jgi:GT2 family glycosyltransferase
VVDDRRRGPALRVPAGVVLLRSGGRGPAAARNVGWRAASARWVAFLDDDVLVDARWGETPARGPRAPRTRHRRQPGSRAGPAARPPPGDRLERNVAGLEDARWITADLCVRRAALIAVGGFDERFARAYREDTDLALRLMDAGWALVRGAREVVHPVGSAGPWVSVAKQAATPTTS